MTSKWGNEFGAIRWVSAPLLKKLSFLSTNRFCAVRTLTGVDDHVARQWNQIWFNEFGNLRWVFTSLFMTLKFLDLTRASSKRRGVCTMLLAVCRKWNQNDSTSWAHYDRYSLPLSRHWVSSSHSKKPRKGEDFVRCCWRLVEDEIKMMRRIWCITMGIHFAFQDIDFLRLDTNDVEKATNLYDVVGGLCNMKSKWCNEFGALRRVFTPLFKTLSFFDSTLTTLKRRWIRTMWLAVFRRWHHWSLYDVVGGL